MRLRPVVLLAAARPYYAVSKLRFRGGRPRTHKVVVEPAFRCMEPYCVSLRYTLIISARVPYMRFPAGDMPRLRLRSSIEGTALPSSATHHIAQQPHQAEPARTFKG
jgi:hypothetical protein